jgi:hypothetical protein
MPDRKNFYKHLLRLLKSLPDDKADEVKDEVRQLLQRRKQQRSIFRLMDEVKARIILHALIGYCWLGFFLDVI